MPPAYFGPKKKKERKKQNWGSGSTPLELCKKKKIASLLAKENQDACPSLTHLPTFHVAAGLGWSHRSAARRSTCSSCGPARRAAGGRSSARGLPGTRPRVGAEQTGPGAGPPALRGLTAALAGGRFEARPGFRASGPPAECQPRKPQRMEMAHQSFVSQALVLRGE